MPPLDFQPIVSWPTLIIGVGGALVLIVWLAWRGLAGLSWEKRAALLALRTAAVLGVAILFANPGHWDSTVESEAPGWAMLLDHSASMSVADGLGGSTRWASAQAFASALAQ
ncbi:MAG: hypothetical protein KDL87_19525, partial [Verrucomicrobiae bacterium]|nr:hypothetical protein [Verrucomicrobiae bacterium]